MIQAALRCALCLLLACAPTQRYAAKSCPSTIALLGDTALTGIALAVSVLAFNAERYARSVTFAGAGAVVALGANISECRR